MTTPFTVVKPAAVTRATSLLCVSLAIVLFGLFWLWFHEAPIGQTIFTFLMMAWIVYKINQGRNWARITFLVIYLLGAVISISLFSLVSHSLSLIEIGVFFVQAALQITALIMLFSRDARPWFNPPIHSPAATDDRTATPNKP